MQVSVSALLCSLSTLLNSFINVESVALQPKLDILTNLSICLEDFCWICCAIVERGASKWDYRFHRLLPPLPDLLSCHPSQHLGGRAAAFYGDENFDEADHDDHDDEGNNQKLVNDGTTLVRWFQKKLSNFVSTLKIC